MAGSARRRSTDDVRTLIIEAAALEFAERGFLDTTVRSVADRAGISSSVLHRHFPTKQQLFSAAMMAPFMQFFDEFVSAWTAQVNSVEHHWSEAELIAEFVRRLFGILKENRQTLLNLMAISDSAESEIVDEVRAGVADMRANLTRISDQEAGGHMLDPGNARTVNRLIAALVTGLVLLQPFFSEHETGEDDEIVESAVRLVLHGAWKSRSS